VIAALAPEVATAVRDDLEDLLSRRGLTARHRQLSAVDRDEVLRPAAEAPCVLAYVCRRFGSKSVGHAVAVDRVAAAHDASVPASS
jgi:hypothetical protein